MVVKRTITCNEDSWIDTETTRVAIAVALLNDIRLESKLQTAEARKQTLEAIKQTAALERLDERAKRNGFSLAKRNRKCAP